MIRFDGAVAPTGQGVAAFDQVVADGTARLWSHDCSRDELAVLCDGLAAFRGELDLAADWPRRWRAAWRYAGDEVACAVRDLGCLLAAGCEPMRRFSWRRTQRHRAGLQFLVSTGRHHGFESLEEARLLLVLDFAADLVDVLGQPVRLRYLTREGAVGARCRTSVSWLTSSVADVGVAPGKPQCVQGRDLVELVRYKQPVQQRARIVLVPAK
jgi:hypothetical protein